MKRRGGKSKFTFIIIMVLAVILIGMNIYSSINMSYKVELVSEGLLENSLNVDGYILRDELVLNSPGTGTLSCNVPEGERVAKNTDIASIFVGNIDEDTQIKLIRLTTEISEYENTADLSDYYSDSLYKIEYKITANVRDIINAVDSGKNIGKISSFKDNMLRAARQISGSSSAKDTLASLKEEKAQIESSISAEKLTILSPIPGVFSSNIDGYETVFDIDNRNMLTPEDFDKVNQMNPSVQKDARADEPVAKIIDNYTWYLTAVVDTSWLDGLATGDAISLRLPDISADPVPAWVDSINDDHDGRSVVIIGCNRIIDTLFSLRRVNVDIIRNRHSGFLISNNAIHDGFVYVIDQNAIHKRPVDVIYTGVTYSVVKTDGEIKIHDEVILDGRNIQEGKVLK